MSDADTKRRNFFVNGEQVDGATLERAEARGEQVDGATLDRAEAKFEFDADEILAAIGLAGKSRCVRLFVAGAVTHVGKTTVCLGILAALRKAGIAANEMAYIKPATQCEAPDLLGAWCKAEGVLNISGENAPLVFYSGFTRSFLDNEQGTSADWIAKIRTRVDELAAGRRMILVDGVGFPAVGSIVGVDNADVAKACRSPVLLVCKSGVGSAVDSFSLNSSYFISKGVPVLGAVFNLGENEGFYLWTKCEESLKKWFEQGSRRENFYGVVPKATSLLGLREKVNEFDEKELLEYAQLNASHFAAYADVAGILGSAASDPWCRSTGSIMGVTHVAGNVGQTFQPSSRSTTEMPGVARSRQEIVAAATTAGAKGGG